MSNRPSGFEFNPINPRQMPFMIKDRFNVYPNPGPDRDVRDGGGGGMVIAMMVAVVAIAAWLVVF